MSSRGEKGVEKFPRLLMVNGLLQLADGMGWASWNARLAQADVTVRMSAHAFGEIIVD